MFYFPLDNYFPHTSYVNLHNPSGITCRDAIACNSLLKDFDGNVISTTYFDKNVSVVPPDNAYNCIKFSTTALSQNLCTDALTVVCELGCGEYLYSLLMFKLGYDNLIKIYLNLLPHT